MRSTKFTKKSAMLPAFAVGASLIISLTSCSLYGEISAPKALLETPTTNSATPTAASNTAASPAPILDEVIPLGMTCSELISVQNLYDINPNLAEITTSNPEEGTLQAEASSRGGITCLYQNLSSTQKISVSVSKLPVSVLASFEKKIGETSRPSTEVLNGYSGSGFFERNKNIGVAQALVGEYWITVSSGEFFEAIDASEFISLLAHQVKPS